MSAHKLKVRRWEKVHALARCFSGAIACALSVAIAHPAMAHSPDAMVLTGFNLCWDGEKGANLKAEAERVGFTHDGYSDALSFYADAEGAVVFLVADYGAGADGRPEPACRITVLRPQIDTPYLRKAAILADASGLLNQIAAFHSGLPDPYRILMFRKPHASRLGRTATLLRWSGGDRAKIVYVEEGPTYVDFLYAHGSAAAIDAPGLPESATSPLRRVGLQAFVNDRWTSAFCDLNPNACAAPQQPQPPKSSTSWNFENWVLPFSGIGAAAARGDNRSHEQRLRDRQWWTDYNYRTCGRAQC